MVCYSVSDCRGKSTSKETTNEALHAAGILAWSITKFGVVLDRSSLWLEDSQALECIQYADLFVHLYLHEASRALQEKRPLYKLRPKWHSFYCEIIERMRNGNSINPRHVGCAGEEDYIGKLCSMIKGSLHASTYGRRTLERALMGLNVHLMEKKKSARKKMKIAT